jgi:hypothetical protein
VPDWLLQAFRPPTVVRQASSSKHQAEQQRAKAVEHGIDPVADLGGEEVDDDVAAAQLAPGHEQGNGGAGGHPGQLEVAGQRPVPVVLRPIRLTQVMTA